MGDGLGSVSLLEAWVPSCPGLLPWEVMCSLGLYPLHTHPVQLSGPFCPGTPTNTPSLDRHCEDSLCGLKGLHLLRCSMGKAWFKFKISSRLSGNSR